MSQNVTKCHSNKNFDITYHIFKNEILFSFLFHDKRAAHSLSYACTITTSEIHELTTQVGRLLLARVGKEGKRGKEGGRLWNTHTQRHTHTHTISPLTHSFLVSLTHFFRIFHSFYLSIYIYIKSLSLTFFLSVSLCLSLSHTHTNIQLISLLSLSLSLS